MKAKDDDGIIAIIDASVAIDLFAGRDKARVKHAERIFKCLESKGNSVSCLPPDYS